MSVYPKRMFCIFISLLVSSIVQAGQVFMSRDADGNVVFSDRAEGNAERHEVKALPTVPAYVVPQRLQTSSSDKAPKTLPDYKSISIVSPRSGETFQNGDANNLMVIVDLQPALLADDTLQLFDNGTLIRQTRAGYFAINDLERGEHKLDVAVYSHDGKEKIRSDAITVYIQRVSVLKNARD